MPATTDSQPGSSQPRTLVAFDFGLKRIGVAVGQTVSDSATALSTISVTTKESLKADVERILGEWQPDVVLVGKPMREKPEPNFEAGLARFEKLLTKLNHEAVFVDERRSSAEASERLIRDRQAGTRKRLRKTDIDAEAARIIAERWLQLARNTKHSV